MALDEHTDEERGASLRALQEREVSIAYSLDVAEHALVEEACAVGAVFARAGIAFDPTTFVALRVLEASVGATGDPVESLEALEQIGLVARSAERAARLLGQAA